MFWDLDLPGFATGPDIRSLTCLARRDNFVTTSVKAMNLCGIPWGDLISNVDKRIYGSSPLRVHRMAEQFQQAMQIRAKIRGLTFWKAAYYREAKPDFGRKVPAA
jgi:hypothetical protein